MMEGFTAVNWKKRITLMPVEDAFVADAVGNIGVAADGVTRDPQLYLPDMKTLSGQLEFAMKYPRPSHAGEAADLFCRTFVVESLMGTEIGEAFASGNKTIKEYNLKHFPAQDYLLNDFAGCVASAVALQGNAVNWGYICDSGVAILDSKGNLKFRTENDGPAKHDKHIWADERLKGRDWREPEARRLIRSAYRNHPFLEHSFGVLTGENEAMHYVKTGMYSCKEGDLVLVFTDGLEHIIFKGDKDVNGIFADRVKKGDWKSVRRLCQEKVHSEGTLVYTQIPEIKTPSQCAEDEEILRRLADD